MIRCCMCNESFHVDCICVTVAEAEGFWNCTLCRGVTNRVNEVHILVRQFSDYIANVTTTNTDLVKELSRKIAGCDEIRSENNKSVNNILTDISIGANSVYKSLKRLDSSKGVGPDGIPTKVLKDAASELALPLCNLFNLTLQTGEIPQ